MFRGKSLQTPIFTAAAWMSVALALLAQDTGRLSGTVVDPTGSAVPGARVELYLAGGQSPVLSTVTTTEGRFSLIGIRTGTYDTVSYTHLTLPTTERV